MMLLIIEFQKQVHRWLAYKLYDIKLCFAMHSSISGRENKFLLFIALIISLIQDIPYVKVWGECHACRTYHLRCCLDSKVEIFYILSLTFIDQIRTQ